MEKHNRGTNGKQKQKKHKNRWKKQKKKRKNIPKIGWRTLLRGGLLIFVWELACFIADGLLTACEHYIYTRKLYTLTLVICSFIHQFGWDVEKIDPFYAVPYLCWIPQAVAASTFRAVAQLLRSTSEACGKHVFCTQRTIWTLNLQPSCCFLHSCSMRFGPVIACFSL